MFGKRNHRVFTQNYMPYTEAYKQLIFNGSEILNLRLCVAFSPLPSLHFLFPSLAPFQTDSTCVAILRTLSIHYDRGLLHVHTFQVHINCWCSCFGLFTALHTYLSEKPVALTNLTGWGLTFSPPSTSYRPLGQLPVFLLHSPYSYPGPAPPPGSDSFTPPDAFPKVTFTMGSTSLTTPFKITTLPYLTLHVIALLSVFTILFHGT